MPLDQRLLRNNNQSEVVQNDSVWFHFLTMKITPSQTLLFGLPAFLLLSHQLRIAVIIILYALGLVRLIRRSIPP